MLLTDRVMIYGTAILGGGMAGLFSTGRGIGAVFGIGIASIWCFLHYKAGRRS